MANQPALWPVQIMLLSSAVPVAIEAYKAKPPGLYVLWAITAAMVIGGIFGPMLVSEQVGAGLDALASNPLTWFILIVALFFVLRPFWQKAAAAYDDTVLRDEIATVTTFAEAAVIALEKTTNETLKQVSGKLDLTIELFGERLEKLEKIATQIDALTVRVNESADFFRAEIDKSNGRFGSMFEHFETVTARLSEGGAAIEKLAKQNEGGLAAALAMMEDQQKRAIEEAAELRQEAARALADQREFQVKMEAWVGQLQRRIRFGLEGVDQGFAAIFDRERLLQMAAEIQDIGDELSGPTQGEALDDRDGWLTKYAAWHGAVEAWAQLAAAHREGVVGRVFDTPSREYKGKWKATANLFPDSDVEHDYKTFRIILRNFQVERKDVDRCLRLAAFAHPSMKARIDPDGIDDEPQPSSPLRKA
jgi:hypothetical protein